MKVTFWGTRGSTPAPPSASDYAKRIQEIIRRASEQPELLQTDRNAFYEQLPFHLRQSYGGHTSCVEVHSADKRIILDAGTGIRELGTKILKESEFASEPLQIDLLISHTHWDHICGLPFFVPLYLKSCTINIYGGHDHLPERFKLQHHKYNFPVDFDALRSNITFTKLEEGKEYTINGFSVRVHRQYHPGGSFGYHIERNGKALTYSTDSEYQDESPEGLKAYTDFAKNSDLLIFDSMYSFNETIEKVDWGHSASRVGIEIAKLANVKRLALFHHDPDQNDETIHGIYQKTLLLKEEILGKTPLEIINSYDSLELEM